MDRWALSAAASMRILDCRRGTNTPNGALGMKMVIELREDSGLETGTVLHTFGFRSRRFSASSTSIRTDWRPWAFSFLRGSAAPCARPIVICSTSSSILICGAFAGGTLSPGAQSRCRNRGAAASLSLWETATRESAKAPGAPMFSPAPAWMKPGPRARTRRSRGPAPRKETAVHAPKSGRDLLRRRRASWVDSESRVAADSRNGFPHGLLSGLFRDGARRLHRRPRGDSSAVFAKKGRVPGRALRCAHPPAELQKLKDEAAERSLPLPRPDH